MAMAVFIHRAMTRKKSLVVVKTMVVTRIAQMT